MIYMMLQYSYSAAARQNCLIRQIWQDWTVYAYSLPRDGSYFLVDHRHESGSIRDKRKWHVYMHSKGL